MHANLPDRLQRHRAGPGGFTLIEVLAATLVLLVGVLGVVGMQMLSLQANQGAMMRSQATFLASELLDAMRTNPTAAANYEGTYPAGLPTTPPPCAVADTGCSAADAATYDLYAWGVQLQPPDPNAADEFQVAIPNATVTVAATANPDEYSVVVSWNERGFSTVTEEDVVEGEVVVIDESTARAIVTRSVTLTSVILP